MLIVSKSDYVDFSYADRWFNSSFKIPTLHLCEIYLVSVC